MQFRWNQTEGTLLLGQDKSTDETVSYQISIFPN